MEAIDKHHQDEFYVDVIKYVNNEPNGISPGTNGATMAKIAKAIIEQRPELAQPNAKDDFDERNHKCGSAIAP
jgi:hypothetical protein